MTITEQMIILLSMLFGGLIIARLLHSRPWKWLRSQKRYIRANRKLTSDVQYYKNQAIDYQKAYENMEESTEYYITKFIRAAHQNDAFRDRIKKLEGDLSTIHDNM